jgi:two-component system, NtrC family, nitrogen regulation sensor histidine kinase GlnL
MTKPVADQPLTGNLAIPASLLMQSLPSPLIAINEGGHVIEANAAAEEFFSLSRTTLKRMGLVDLAPFSSPLFSAVERLRNTGTTLAEYGIKLGTPRSGGERTVDILAGTVPELPGAMVLLILERSVAQAFDRQFNNLQAARSVSGMASMLAHEIKNPLSGIRGAAQLLETVAAPEDRELTRLICTETDRIRSLVDQMEVFSDERLPVMEPLNVHTVLEHVRRLATSGFAAGIEFTELYDPSLPPVQGNRDQLVQVFLNLVKNAAEAIEKTDSNGKITLSSAYRPGIRMQVQGSDKAISLPLEISVRDNGPGIPDDMMGSLFDPFVTSKDSGRGLGLALVAKLVRDHGGVVDAANLGEGTIFRVLLPLSTRTSTDGSDT